MGKHEYVIKNNNAALEDIDLLIRISKRLATGNLPHEQWYLIFYLNAVKKYLSKKAK